MSVATFAVTCIRFFLPWGLWSFRCCSGAIVIGGHQRPELSQEALGGGAVPPPAGPFVVSISTKSKVRCLHRPGSCWRKSVANVGLPMMWRSPSRGGSRTWKSPMQVCPLRPPRRQAQRHESWAGISPMKAAGRSRMMDCCLSARQCWSDV